MMRHARPDYDRIQDPSGLIPHDEPVFLLRGQDRAAPGAVEAWANLAKASGADAAIVEMARNHAQLMREYQAACCNKVPDLPVPGDAGFEEKDTSVELEAGLDIWANQAAVSGVDAVLVEMARSNARLIRRRRAALHSNASGPVGSEAKPDELARCYELIRLYRLAYPQSEAMLGDLDTLAKCRESIRLCGSVLTQPAGCVAGMTRSA